MRGLLSGISQFVLRGALASAVVISATDIVFAQAGVSPAQKKYQREVTALFEGLEIAEFTLAASSIREDGKLQPVVKLRNKTNHELEVPFAVGITSGEGGVLGYPSWQIERSDRKGRQPIRHDGSLVRSLKVGPGAFIEVDSKTQSPISPEVLGLMPGEYKIAISFRPHGSAGANIVHPLTAKPLKFTVLPGEARASGQVGAGENITRPPSTKLKFSYGRGKESLDAASIGLSQFELGSETVKSGVPLLFSVEVSLSKGRTSLESTEGAVPPLNFAWIIHRLGSKNGLKMRTYLTHLTVGIGRSQWSALCQQGELLLKSEVETVGMEPGSYELSLRFWQTGLRSEDGFEVPRPVSFKVTK